jgi:hypothetical protein
MVQVRSPYGYVGCDLSWGEELNLPQPVPAPVDDTDPATNGVPPPANTAATGTTTTSEVLPLGDTTATSTTTTNPSTTIGVPPSAKTTQMQRPRPIRPELVQAVTTRPPRPRFGSPTSMFRGTGFRFPLPGTRINVPPTTTTIEPPRHPLDAPLVTPTTNGANSPRPDAPSNFSDTQRSTVGNQFTTPPQAPEPRRTQSEPDWNRFPPFAQLDSRFSSHNDRTPARTHSEAADEGQPRATDPRLAESETEGLSPKRRRYYDPSKVSVS